MRFDRPSSDARGPAFDRRHGRYEGAYARRAALDAWEAERPHGPRHRPQGHRRRYVPWHYGAEFVQRDRDYSRRYWPPADQRNHRWD